MRYQAALSVASLAVSQAMAELAAQACAVAPRAVQSKVLGGIPGGRVVFRSHHLCTRVEVLLKALPMRDLLARHSTAMRPKLVELATVSSHVVAGLAASPRAAPRWPLCSAFRILAIVAGAAPTSGPFHSAACEPPLAPQAMQEVLTATAKLVRGLLAQARSVFGTEDCATLQAAMVFLGAAAPSLHVDHYMAALEVAEAALRSRAPAATGELRAQACSCLVDLSLTPIPLPSQVQSEPVCCACCVPVFAA